MGKGGFSGGGKFGLSGGGALGLSGRGLLGFSGFSGFCSFVAGKEGYNFSEGAGGMGGGAWGLSGIGGLLASAGGETMTWGASEADFSAGIGGRSGAPGGNGAGAFFTPLLLNLGLGSCPLKIKYQ